MRKLFLCAAMLVVGSAASAEEFKRELQLSKGKARVTFVSIAPEMEPKGPAKNPKVGIAPPTDAQFGGFLARQLDESSRVNVVSPTRMAQTELPAGFDFESVTRSELKAAVSAGCRSQRLDYLLMLGSSQATGKVDVTAYIVGFGRIRMRQTQQARLYDCRSQAIVWNQTIEYEGSQGLMSSALSGTTMGNAMAGPDAAKAYATAFGDKLVADMRW